jgi:acetyltransferase-like isoleucine patch superfamily enzyme
MAWRKSIGIAKRRLRFVLSFLWRWELKLIGVKWDSPLVLCGRPFVSRCNGSVIKWGHGVFLDSSRRNNPLGGEKPCIVRTLTQTARIELGNEVGVSNSTIVAGNAVTIGEGTILGAGCMILDNDFHSYGPAFSWITEYQKTSKPIKIGRGCFLGARAIVLKGVTLGDRVIIGAGSVVTHDIPSHSIAAGNPAKVVFTRGPQKPEKN